MGARSSDEEIRVALRRMRRTRRTAACRLGCAPAPGARPHCGVFRAGEEDPPDGGLSLGCAPAPGVRSHCGEFLAGEEDSQDGGLSLGCAPAPGARPARRSRRSCTAASMLRPDAASLFEMACQGGRVSLRRTSGEAFG